MAHVSMLSIFLCTSLFLLANAGDIGQSCLPGTKHKAKPGPEGSEYKACRIFKESSCCTAEFTNQLAVPVVQKIGTFSWTLCGNLSKKCQDFMVGVECFYSCSPYVAHWRDKDDKQAFNNAPVCSHYCDDWLDACRDDMTCAKNWLKGFNISADWSNSCKKDSPCKPFKEVFTSGKDLCENIWDDSFKYTKPVDGPCLHFNFSGNVNPNKDVVMKIFGHSSATQASLLLLPASLFFVIANLILI